METTLLKWGKIDGTAQWHRKKHTHTRCIYLLGFCAGFRFHWSINESKASYSQWCRVTHTNTRSAIKALRNKQRACIKYEKWFVFGFQEIRNDQVPFIRCHCLVYLPMGFFYLCLHSTNNNQLCFITVASFLFWAQIHLEMNTFLH